MGLTMGLRKKTETYQFETAVVAGEIKKPGLGNRALVFYRLTWIA